MEQSTNQQQMSINVPSIQIGFGNYSSIEPQSQSQQYNNRRQFNNNNNYNSSSYNRGNQFGERSNNQTEYRNYDNRNNNQYGDRKPYNNNNNRGPFRNNRGGQGGRGGGQFRNFENFNNDNQNTYHYQPKQPEDLTYITKYRTEIDLILYSFTNLTERDCIDLIKRFEQNTAQTIFESINEISKENYCKKRNTGIYFYNMDIFETKDLKYLQANHEKILKYYKVFKQADHDAVQNLPDNYYYINESERRRKLRKNEEGAYNYLPIQCTTIHDNDILLKEKCNYAHTENEINYHSLQYHTKICRRNDECKFHNVLCYDSHGIEEDFRIIYNYQLKEICLLMNKLSIKLPKVDPYERYFEKDNKFNLNKFKVNKCFYGNKCKLDYHCCINYHKDEERRRPPLLFRYGYQMCKDAKENDKIEFNPQLCEMGDYCPFVHRIYEYYYHEKMFRKIVPCKMEEEQGRCPFSLTCYKIHSGYDQELQEKKQKLNNYKKIIQNLKCPICGSPNELNTYVLMKCSHFLCIKCFAQAAANKKCPECKAKISREKNYKIEMGKAFEENTIPNEEDNKDETDDIKQEIDLKEEEVDESEVKQSKTKRKKKKKQQQTEKGESNEEIDNTFNK